MKMNWKTMLLAVSLSAPAFAAPMVLTGTGVEDYTPKDAASRDAAFAKAKETAFHAALDNLMARQSDSARQAFNERKPAVYQELLGICTNTGFEPKDTGDCVVVKFQANLDDVAMMDKIQSMKSAGSDVQLNDVKVAVLFTARRIASNTVFGAEVSAEETGEASSEASVTEAATDSADAVVETKKTHAKKTAGTAVTQKVDAQSYELDDVAKSEFNDGLSAVLLDKGFEEVVDLSMTLESAAKIDEVMGAGKKPTPALWKEVAAAIAEEDPDIQYVIVGCFDAENPHEVGGQWESAATVTGNVYKLDNKNGKYTLKPIVALKPTTLKEKSNSQLDAKKTTMQCMTDEIAREILLKMQQKKIINK